MGKDVIVACDFAKAREVYDFLGLFEERKPFVKIGMELFYSEGPEIVREVKKMGHRVFLDLKCHDIPNTVEKTMKVIGGLGVDICNVHAAGTIKMMEAAKKGLLAGTSENMYEKPLLIAVTQLTSTDEETMQREILIDKPLGDVVIEYAKNAGKAGLDGVVCSPWEANDVHKACGDDFVTVTPGVRFEEDSKGDQKRVMTPAKAKEAGSDYIVVGRSITAAEDPIAAYERCIKEFI